jgi:uncharacterized coiled-coil protein SlyX
MLKLNSIKKATIALSTLLLMGTAQATKTSQSYDEQPHTSAAGAHARLTQEQEGWWAEYLVSKKTAVEYIETVSHTKPEVALWFLSTGGKYGYCKDRVANPEESKMMISALRKVVSHFSKSENRQAGIDAWDMAKLTPGQANMKALYFAFCDFQERLVKLELANNTLMGNLATANTKIKGLEERVASQQTTVDVLNAKVSAFETRIHNQDQLLSSTIDQSQRSQEAFRTELIKSMEAKDSKQNEFILSLFDRFKVQQNESLGDLRTMITQNKDEAVAREVRIIAEAQARETANKKEAEERERRIIEEAKAREEENRREAQAERSRLVRMIEEANARERATSIRADNLNELLLREMKLRRNITAPQIITELSTEVTESSEYL